MTYAPAPQPGASRNSPPLAFPLYGASFGQAFVRFWKKYATFSGRASRSEFWWWYLANVCVILFLYAFMAIGAVAGATYDPVTESSQPGPLIGVGAALLVLWSLATIVPTLALSWRRLHDTNRSGAFWFLGFVPFVGGIILLVFFILDSNPEGARFDA
ncbi:DUF805 domain-containing protein [Microbacterium sp. P06]|uniref:DUF805 domain-containing protein n=1 Tax=Microbacterium sp. P06 TaxID=3366949 RepID=UPI003745F77A